MMEVTYDTSSKTVTVIKWNVVIPREKGHLETKIFLVNGVRSKLSLDTSISVYSNTQGYEYWSMHLEGDFKEKFPLILYIRHERNDIFLNAITINSSQRQQIWAIRYSDFKKNFPSISVAGNALEFLLDFELDSGSHGNSQGECKSLQASDSTTSSEKHPCLENLSLDMSKLMDGSSDADVQLTCRDLTIRAHKCILSVRSEVFRNMLRSDMLEGRKGVVDIVDMEPEVLQFFIRYVYTGTLPALTEDTILSLYEAADKYQMDGLKKRSSHLLSTILSQENALGILVIADAHDDKDLKSRVSSYIVDKKIPRNDENWLKFCNEHPKLAVDVLNCQIFRGS